MSWKCYPAVGRGVGAGFLAFGTASCDSSPMTNENDVQDYTVRVRPRGGAGRNAVWQWEVYAPGNALPVEKGVYTGPEARAFQAAQAALARQRERQAAKAKGA